MIASASLRPRSFCLLLAFACTVALRAAESTPAATTPALAEQLAAFVAQPRFAGAMWGVKVVSLDSGRTLFEHQPHLRLSPASNAKLYVGALALDRLGGDYRIVTPLLGTAPVDAQGDLPGDLVIAGRADPSWHPRLAKREFWSTFEPFVTALREAGVRRIRGDLVADATWLHGPPYGAGWTADDLNDYYGAEISALTLGDNYVELRVAPAAGAGQPCTVEILEPHTGLVIDNHTLTTAPGTKSFLRVLRFPGTHRVRIFGGLPVGGEVEVTEATVPQPARWFAAALKEALVRSGIAVDGVARSVAWPDASPTAAVPLGAIASPTMRDLVTAFMQPSQNLETNLVFAHLGELLRTADTPRWKQSDELAIDALHGFVRDIGVPPDAVIFEDGSGLSRNNLTTAAATVRLLEFMAGHREAEAFLHSLPLAGRDGTIRKRLVNTPAEGNLRAKTGTLRWASSLSGYVHNAAGERLAFSLMLNRHVSSPDRRTRDELDELAVLLASSTEAK
ncbi:MAG: D-alanyl-D-alanine carboxypeptidase/D-alanyl-D-alanine-endopeptidase [Candidatus Didemnitutus sp.]|nr:D-alanyl-D-alanine carboxypeptidase/D-alanyl-D-alanine-endopeptidase [Candidatus Didemnitutus sp.]